LLFVFFLVTACSRNEEYLLIGLNQEKTGIYFSNTLKNSPSLNILNYLYYYNGAGVVAADFNNDGYIDLFFSGNQVQDELYINQGNLSFKPTTTISGMVPTSSWSTGATHVDINNDGLLDIYICKVSGYHHLTGKNLLYVNQGTDAEGVPIFKEVAAEYGLDFSGMSTHAAFFDYDLDGDMDMYLLNHSVHPNRNYGQGKLRQGYHPQFGDILFRNNNGHFEDVSEEAGIFQGKIGYGLGISIADVNNDSYPDIYVGNDFFENDYLYINQKDGRFKEIISNDNMKLGHTTHFSMGNTIADLNNDGLSDIVSLDMLPENLETYKSSGLEYAYPIYRQYLNKGYSPQYMQNTFHVNIDGQNFSEIAYLSGIAATEWSWGVLPLDLDNDGYKDLFISNGIVGATNDMDYMNFIANEDIQRRIDNGLHQNDLPMVQEIPQKKVPNYVFRNRGNLTFENVSSYWIKSTPTFSNGSVYADFDNDGDLDLVINTINEPVIFLENTSLGTNSITLKFNGPENNLFGIGAKVILYSSEMQVQENFPTKGYLSTVPPELYFGLGKDSIIDSLKVKWPDGKIQSLRDIKANQTIVFNHREAIAENNKTQSYKNRFVVIDSVIPFAHNENISLDFDREPLVPFSSSNEGPSVAINDINNDNRQDIFIGGAKRQSSRLFVQQSDGNFVPVQNSLFEKNNIKETTCSHFFDANGDGWQDLVVGYGGNEFAVGQNVRPQLYINHNGILEVHENAFNPSIEGNLASIKTTDFDEDGDLDLILIADRKPGNFGETPESFVLFNNGKGYFEDVTPIFAPDFRSLGNLKDIEILDLNADGKKDVIAIGHWIPISIFLNNGKQLQLQKNSSLEQTQGWWNSIEMADFDNDGDLDMMCGNWGLNTKFNASVKKPIT
ncbi:MAG: VCBS repeat-containing protein, partial [Bacteroidota bacterium]